MVRLLVYLFEIFVVILVARFLSRAWQQFFGTPQTRARTGTGAPPQRSPEVRPMETARDPVCGVFVPTENSHRLRQGTQTLHFCSRECLERYQREIAHAAS